MQHPNHRKPQVARVPVVVPGRYPNRVWAVDFHSDETVGGLLAKILNATD